MRTTPGLETTDGAGGRLLCVAGTSTRCGRGWSGAQRGPRPATGRWLYVLECRGTAQLRVWTAGLATDKSRGRRSGRVSWAVYSHANAEKPAAVRMARRALWATERSLACVRSPKLVTPTLIAQIVVYRHGRSTARCAQWSDEGQGQIGRAATAMVFRTRPGRGGHGWLRGNRLARAGRSRCRGS